MESRLDTENAERILYNMTPQQLVKSRHEDYCFFSQIEQFSFINNDPGLLCLTLLCDWSRKPAPLLQPMKCKTTTNPNLVTRVFPRFKQVACF